MPRAIRDLVPIRASESRPFESLGIIAGPVLDLAFRDGKLQMLREEQEQFIVVGSVPPEIFAQGFPRAAWRDVPTLKSEAGDVQN